MKFFEDRMTDYFTPVKVFTKWSKLMSLTYVVLADFRNTSIAKTIREKFVDKINTSWCT